MSSSQGRPGAGVGANEVTLFSHMTHLEYLSCVRGVVGEGRGGCLTGSAEGCAGLEAGGCHLTFLRAACETATVHTEVSGVKMAVETAMVHTVCQESGQPLR